MLIKGSSVELLWVRLGQQQRFFFYKYIKIIFIFYFLKFIFTINIYKRSKNIKKYLKKKQLNHALKHPIKISMIIHAI
jgi:hypothetical protein